MTRIREEEKDWSQQAFTASQKSIFCFLFLHFWSTNYTSPSTNIQTTGIRLHVYIMSNFVHHNVWSTHMLALSSIDMSTKRKGSLSSIQVLVLELIPALGSEPSRISILIVVRTCPPPCVAAKPLCEPRPAAGHVAKPRRDLASPRQNRARVAACAAKLHIT